MENSNEKSGKGQLVALIALILVALLLVAAIVWILLDRSKPQEVPQQSQQTEASSETTKTSEQPTEDPFPTVDFFPGYGDDETEPSEEPDEEEPTQGNTDSAKPLSIFNGEHADPLFRWLAENSTFEGFGMSPMGVAMSGVLKKIDKDYKSSSSVKWNFTKFLVGRDGKLIARFEPTVSMKKVAEAVASSL